MKKLFLVLTCLSLSLFSASAHSESLGATGRSNELLRFLAEQRIFRDLALHSILAPRCRSYEQGDEIGPCQDTLFRMIGFLDFDIILTGDAPTPEGSWTPRNFVFVAFKKNLISLLSSPKTQAYLVDLNRELYRFLLDERKDLSIWDFTMSHFRSEYQTSLVLAALFQDTSLMKLHLAYLERARISGPQSFENNKELLSRVIDTINLILDTSEDNYRKIFYPKEIQDNLNRNIYHFYVPLFLAQALKKAGVPALRARNATLMLTLSYEFVTSAPDYRYLYEDPMRITSLGKVKDIFGGYVGASLGVNRSQYLSNFEVIRASFERSTEDAVRLLLQF
jgi:hypothetical protein